MPVVLPHLIGTGNRFGHGDQVLAQGAYPELVVGRTPLDPRATAQAATELLGYRDDTVQDPRTAGDGMVRSTVWSLWRD
ncbi:hypothetical protein [Streptomyces sp. NPDC058664]|uniref:hypothetical protein n=1 Tax=unclassified Streptomyces TaxID=2593676 RepID=UPI00364F9F94